MIRASEVKRAFVVGAGLMGSGIAHTFAQAGLEVKVRDVSDEILARARQRLAEVLDSRVARGKMEVAAAEAILSRIRWTTNLEDFADADVVVEAVTENLDLKKEVFSALDRICHPDVVLLTNTSTLSPTAIAAATKRPDKVLGFHFMNPAPVMRLVEIVPGILTSPETVDFGREFARRIGKTPVVAKDHPGGIASRIMVTMRNEAIRIFAEGIASAEDIDTAMKLAGNFPMGPLELTDLVGLDVHYNNSMSLARELGPQYLPHPIVKKMVDAGLLGKKVGRGFYDYAKGDRG